MLRRCPACGEEKEQNDQNFYRRTGTNRVHTYCKPCYLVKCNITLDKKRFTDDYKTKRRFEQRKRRMGVSQSTFLSMFQEQNHLCAICKQELVDGTGKVHVDHNHLTGAVRKLLCRRCNMMIGMADDNISILLNAAEYLRNHDTV
jgi:hypothetical protein